MKGFFKIVLISCCLVLLWNPLGSSNERAKLILTLDLRTLGYRLPVAERDFRAYAFLQDSVAFLDDRLLAVSFLSKNQHPGLSRRDGTPGSEVVFQSVFLDPLAGVVSGQRIWGNEGNWNELHALENGSFLVQDNEWVRICYRSRIYSGEIRERVRRKLEIPGDLQARFSVSPSGHSLYEFQDAYDAKRGWLTRIDLLDPETLLTRRSKLTPGHQFETVSDTQVVYFPTAFNGALRLFVYDINDGPPRKGPELFKKKTWPERVVAESGCNSAAFINDDVLAITGGCPALILVHSNNELSQIHFPEYLVGGELQPSRGGRRFAFFRTRAKEKPPHITYMELCVYDLAERKIVFNTLASPPPQHKLGFAVSPNGSLFALQVDALLRLWSLD
jgi:hypothetical protein